MGLPALNMEDLPHYTYEDYAQWEGKWEIIHGIPYAMTPSPVMKHQRICLKMASQLDMLLEHCNSTCGTYESMDWQITEDTVLKPDIMVVCGNYSEGKKLMVPPVLVVEVLSPSTKHKDRGIKYRLYKQAGVKYYCMVDPDLECIEVLMLHDNGTKKEVFDEEVTTITFQIGEFTISLDIERIFNRGYKGI